MRVIIAGITVAVVLAIAAGGAYTLAQRPVFEAQPSQSVRIGDPGYNLVGPDWTGDPRPNQSTDVTGSGAANRHAG